MQRLGDGALRFERPAGLPASALLERLRSLPGVVDAVVTATHACVTFDPSAPPDGLAAAVASWSSEPARHVGPARIVTVRVRYDGADLDAVARRVGLTSDEVATLHAKGAYTVNMIGFLPGFAYLEGVDPRLSIPRRPPRPRVPANAVAIAAGYSGVYPFASAGGWHLLGTALDFCAFTAERGAVLALGDVVRFERVP